MGKKIKDNALSIPVMFEKLDEISNNDVRFTKVRIWLMHLGENENACFFSKEVVDEAIPSLSYIPIVGFLENNKLGEEDFSDHRYVLTRDKNGNIHRKYMGNAYGVILSKEDNNAHYEERLCDDGIKRTFLVVDGLIWNIFEDSAEILNRDLIKSHSMELVDTDDENYLDGYEDKNGIFRYTKITFRGACILGKSQEPAMINSTIEVQFTVNDFTKAIQEELANKITEFEKLINKNKEKGSEKMADVVGCKTTNIEEGKTTDFTLTNSQLSDRMYQIVRDFEKYNDKWGDEVSRYWFVDILEDKVIVADRKENHNLYAFSYSVNGDEPSIDFTNGQKMKMTYVPFEGSESTNGLTNFSFKMEEEFGSKIEAIKTDYTSKIENAEAELKEQKGIAEKAVTDYENLKTEYDEIKPKYEDFCKKEKEAIEEAIASEKKALFTKFDSYLSDVAEYAELKENAENMSIEDIDTKCAIMFTKKEISKSTDFTKKENNASVDIIEEETDKNYVHTKYGNILVGNR